MLRLGSVCAHPDRLVDIPYGVGWSRPPAAGRDFNIASVQQGQSLFEGQPSQFSPEQDCLDVGRNRARALCVGKCVLGKSLLMLAAVLLKAAASEF